MSKPLDAGYSHKINLIFAIVVKLLRSKIVKDEEDKELLKKAEALQALD
jgi:hypothetical protein